MGVVTATSNGQQVSANYTLPTAGGNGIPATPVVVLPSIPEVSWASLNPIAGENFGTTLNRLKTPARVVLPAGTFNVIDNAESGYGFYAPTVLGLRGAGIGQTIIQWAPNSIKTKVALPASAGTLGRMGPNGSASGVQITLSDLTLQGTPQIGSDGVTPMNTSGFVNYWGRKFVMMNVKVQNSLNYGSGNSPNAGETFALNMFHDTDTIISNVEVDGRDAAGNQVAASPFGSNNSHNITLIDCYFHDSGWSGLTFSYTSTPSIANATYGVTTYNLKIAHNANHYQATKSSARFAGVNHEQIQGPIRHYNPDIQLDHPELWDSMHMSFGSNIGDDPDIEIHNPIWHEAPPKSNGAFTIGAALATIPKVFDAEGKQMTAVTTHGQPATVLNVDPKTQFVCFI